ncbi:ankyrin repeat-containing domain protein, partial [Baffinella frigidus]
GAPALWSAAQAGRTQEVLKMLAEGADFEERGGPTLTTPLFIAAHKGHEGVVRVLLKHGANTSAKDRQGWTPLHRAANRGREGVVTLLLEYGADVAAECNSGETPLMCAACWGHETIVKMLLEKG